MFYCHLKATPFVQKLRKEMKKNWSSTVAVAAATPPPAPQMVINKTRHNNASKRQKKKRKQNLYAKVTWGALCAACGTQSAFKK